MNNFNEINKIENSNVESREGVSVENVENKEKVESVDIPKPESVTEIQDALPSEDVLESIESVWSIGYPTSNTNVVSSSTRVDRSEKWIALLMKKIRTKRAA